MKVFSLLCLMFFVNTCFAGTVSGTIDELIVGRNGNELYIKTTGTHSNSPCVDQHPLGFQFAIDLNKVQDAVLSSLFIAFSSGDSVVIQGAGSCAGFDARLELFGYVFIKK